MTDLADQIAERAREYLEAAKDSAAEERWSVAYEEARTAAELASKALLQRTAGRFPRDHNPAGLLKEKHLLPSDLSAQTLSKLLGDFSRGAYGFLEAPTSAEVREALKVAKRLVALL